VCAAFVGGVVVGGTGVPLEEAEVAVLLASAMTGIDRGTGMVIAGIPMATERGTVIMGERGKEIPGRAGAEERADIAEIGL
jgi:hypothetical protein